MKFRDTLLPKFGNSWIEHCMKLVEACGGCPPHIATPVYDGQLRYAHPGTVAASEDAMNAHLMEHGSDLCSRFVVLRYLWAASSASASPDLADYPDEMFNGGMDAVEKAADADLREAVRPILTAFVDRLPPSSIASPEQALWEFKQAVIFHRPDRLKALAQRYREITAQPADQSNLMLARALWLLAGKFRENLICQIEFGGLDFPWEEFIEKGDSSSPLFPIVPPTSGQTTEDTDLLFDAIACLQKVNQGALGPHWAVLADCWLGARLPEESAKIWEQHGLEIVASAAEANGRRADEVLLLPEYQLGIADLWAEGGRIDKEIAVLESLGRRAQGCEA